MDRKERHLVTTYGITEEQYQHLLFRQNGVCAGCERPPEVFKTRLAVDHDHVSGEVRGLLCTHCNHRVLGRHRDSGLLRRLADYLDRGTGWFVPEKPKRVRTRKRAPRKKVTK